MGRAAAGRARLGQAGGPDLSRLDPLIVIACRPIVALTVIAAAIRIALVLLFDEAPGDGPTRAAMGWHWHLTGHTSFYANWLPGHEILTGLVFRLLPDPMLGARLLSLATGIAAVPLLHRLGGRLAGPEAALIAAAALAVSPMHAALSATSLSEAPALTALLAALLAAFRLGERFDDAVAWAILAVAGMAGASIRFEFWLVPPILVLHQLWASRSLRRAALVTLALAPFPLLWAAARIEIGGVGGAYAGAVSGAALVGASAVALEQAVPIFLRTLTGLVGVPLALAAGVGVIVAARSTSAERAGADRVAWLLLLATLTLFLMKFTADRGAALWPRYLLTEAVLLLPAAGLAVWRVRGPRLLRAGVAALLLAGAPLTMWHTRPELYLVRTIPEPTRTLAGWIASELDPAQPVLITKIDWQSSYLIALAEMAPDRYRIISAWLDDAGLRSFALRWRPRLLITSDRDRDLVRRLESVTGLAPHGPPVASFGELMVLPLRPAAPPPAQVPSAPGAVRRRRGGAAGSFDEAARGALPADGAGAPLLQPRPERSTWFRWLSTSSARATAASAEIVGRGPRPDALAQAVPAAAAVTDHPQRQARQAVEQRRCQRQLVRRPHAGGDHPSRGGRSCERRPRRASTSGSSDAHRPPVDGILPRPAPGRKMSPTFEPRRA